MGVGVAGKGLVARCPCIAPNADRAECAVPGGDARVHHDGLESLGMAGHQQRCHACAGRQPCDRDSRAIDRVQQAHLVDRLHDQGGFAISLARGGVEPVPASLRVGEAVLLGIQHQKAFARGEPVHARSQREALRILPATVQHDHQWQSLTEIHPWRLVKPESARPGRAHGDACCPGSFARWGLAFFNHRPNCLCSYPIAGAQGTTSEPEPLALEVPGQCEGERAFSHCIPFRRQAWRAVFPQGVRAHSQTAPVAWRCACSQGLRMSRPGWAQKVLHAHGRAMLHCSISGGRLVGRRTGRPSQLAGTADPRRPAMQRTSSPQLARQSDRTRPRRVAPHRRHKPNSAWKRRSTIAACWKQARLG